ncbi:MAG TPA: type VI secretion system tip protein TssI/VgrG [Herpetosiphonaceae bacterium]
MSYSQANSYLSVSTPLGKDQLLLKMLHGTETISGLFHYTLEMVSENKNLSFDSIVGKSATVSLAMGNDSTRYINGIVGRFYQAGTDGQFTTYYAELYPWLWLLTLTSDSRIFQAKSAPEIITAVFDELGFSDYKKSLSKTYTARDYCVQYQETAFQFVSRLMEDEGISYFFEHSDGTHTLVLADDADAFAACPGLSGAIRYQSSLAGDTTADAITQCTFERQVTPTKYAVDDFNFETPSNDLLSSQSSGSGNLALYEYPAGFTAKGAGSTKAKLRLGSLQVPKTLLRGQSFSPAFTPGHTFTLVGHDRDEANAKYVLWRVSHSATTNGYTNSFEAFPASVPFYPQHQTPRPVIPGTQTAIVVGPSGEEILTDSYGRVKVQFHWDRLGKSDENSSCWIRVAQGWAGKSWGSIFIPRIGQEVVVSFLNGDPDRPLITGCVYNAEQTVPYALPGAQTQSTIKSNTSKGGSGSNEIRFEDLKDSEELYIHAQKDLNIQVEKGNRATTLLEGNDTLSVEKGNRTVEIKTGDETHSVKGKRGLTITGDETHTNEANFTQKVSGSFTLNVDGDLTIDVTGSVTIKAGQSLATKAGMNIENKADMNIENKAGMNLTNKAEMSLTSEAGVSMTNKGGATHTVESGGILTVKGALVKMN